MPPIECCTIDVCYFVINGELMKEQKSKVYRVLSMWLLIVYPPHLLMFPLLSSVSFRFSNQTSDSLVFSLIA